MELKATAPTVSRYQSIVSRKLLSNFIKYTSLIIASFIVLLPPSLIFLNAFKSNEEYAASNVFELPHSFLFLNNFKIAMSLGHLDRAFLNTGIIILATLIGNVIIGTMAAYALGRIDFKLKKVILIAYIAATVIPTVTTQVATFSIIKYLGLFNTYLAPTLLYQGTDVLQIYIFLQFIRNIPFAIDESAMIEGASLFKIYRSLIFPLITPAIATVIIIKTISIYNDMYTPYLYMPSNKLGVVSTSLMKFVGNNTAQWNIVCAAIIIIIIPTVCLFLIMQRYVFSGIVSGAVK